MIKEKKMRQNEIDGRKRREKKKKTIAHNHKFLKAMKSSNNEKE